MEMIVDLHVHSHYSRATSKDMNLSSLYRWGKIKGINVIGTGDFTHPAWFEELRSQLEPAEPGLFKLKDELSKPEDEKLPSLLQKNWIRFVLTSEISNIYSKASKVRKLHNLIVAPSFESVSEINSRLSAIGNLKADGRPILGLDSKELLKISLETDPDNLFIPAHIWTPWFALFGSRSGFDSLEEAFEELTPNVYAVETGLSSDPYMNWRLSGLDKLTLVSNSDAHSAANLGREANVLDCEISYLNIIRAIKSGDEHMVGTIEFFPQEGKYHFDGHRACDISLSPQESEKLNNICPKCGKPLVLGVDHRVEDLADRKPDFKPERHKRVEYIIPLAEMIAEISGVKSVTSTKVVEQYNRLTATFGDEFSLLRKVLTKEITEAGFSYISEAIQRMRESRVYIEPGYDGVFGKIKVFSPSEKTTNVDQISLGI